LSGLIRPPIRSTDPHVGVATAGPADECANRHGFGCHGKIENRWRSEQGNRDTFAYWNIHSAQHQAWPSISHPLSKLFWDADTGR
jgi:hypothetical protein